MYICFPIRWQENQELSLWKAYRIGQLKAIDFFRSLQSVYKLRLFLQDLLSDLEDFALKDHYRKEDD